MLRSCHSCPTTSAGYQLPTGLFRCGSAGPACRRAASRGVSEAHARCCCCLSPREGCTARWPRGTRPLAKHEQPSCHCIPSSDGCATRTGTTIGGHAGGASESLLEPPCTGPQLKRHGTASSSGGGFVSHSPSQNSSPRVPCARAITPALLRGTRARSSACLHQLVCSAPSGSVVRRTPASRARRSPRTRPNSGLCGSAGRRVGSRAADSRGLAGQSTSTFFSGRESYGTDTAGRRIFLQSGRRHRLILRVQAVPASARPLFRCRPLRAPNAPCPPAKYKLHVAAHHDVAASSCRPLRTISNSTAAR